MVRLARDAPTTCRLTIVTLQKHLRGSFDGRHNHSLRAAGCCLCRWPACLSHSREFVRWGENIGEVCSLHGDE
jgi:hypothetical protein